jgi:FkbM family methyltransferase
VVPLAELIFDLGLHNGEDTAHYLASGYDVVAVDASPAKCEAAAERFALEIAAGRLEIVNAAIADARGVAEFWVSSYSEWSSLDRARATSFGATAAQVTVSTMTVGELLLRHRTPVYVKIDIEGADSLCLRELSGSASPPTYVSFEWSDQTPADIDVLEGVGYRGFKFLRQNDHREITPRNIGRHDLIRALVKRLRAGSIPYRACRRLYYHPRRIAGEVFPLGSSGPLPWKLLGRWLSAEEAKAVWLRTTRVHQKGPAVWEWFDIHAKRGSV